MTGYEARALAKLTTQVRELGIPIPKVLARGFDDETRYGFVIVEEIPGCPLYRIDDRRAQVIEAGRLLGKLHSHKLIGFGGLKYTSRGLVGRRAGFETAFRELMSSDLLAELQDAGLVTAGQADWTQQIVTEMLSSDELEQPVFLHGDFHLGHVFSDGSKITGILDWARARAGDRHYDLALASYFMRDEFGVLMRGYELPFQKRRVENYCFLIALRKVHWAYRNVPKMLTSKREIFQRIWQETQE